MSNRCISPYDSVLRWIQSEKPQLSFDGEDFEDYLAWRKRFKDRLTKLLGKTPEKVPLNPEVVDSVDMGTYVREKVVFDSDRYNSIPAYVLVPKDIGSEKRPAILAAHGHGNGKADVCGDAKDWTPTVEQHVALFKYNYGVKFVERGYVVISPDWRGFGERESPVKWVGGRDKDNVNYLAYGYIGYHLLTLQIWDGMRTIDYLQFRREVDKNRIGCAGLSFGGTMTTYLAALDDRIKVACISGYLSTIRGDGTTMRGIGSSCGAQYMPGLLTIGDIPDVAGLIAPKPLLIEMGEKDTGFIIEDAKRAYAHLKRIYTAAGVPERLDCDIHPGGHVWSGEKAYKWFERWLQHPKTDLGR